MESSLGFELAVDSCPCVCGRDAGRKILQNTGFLLKILQLKHVQLHWHCNLTLWSFQFKLLISVKNRQPNDTECALAIQIASILLQLRLASGRQNTLRKKGLIGSNWLNCLGSNWQSPGINTKHGAMQNIFIEKSNTDPEGLSELALGRS